MSAVVSFGTVIRFGTHDADNAAVVAPVKTLFCRLVSQTDQRTLEMLQKIVEPMMEAEARIEAAGVATPLIGS
jgi:hypothetical protein